MMNHQYRLISRLATLQVAFHEDVVLCPGPFVLIHLCCQFQAATCEGRQGTPPGYHDKKKEPLERLPPVRKGFSPSSLTRHPNCDANRRQEGVTFHPVVGRGCLGVRVTAS